MHGLYPYMAARRCEENMITFQLVRDQNKAEE